MSTLLALCASRDNSTGANKRRFEKMVAEHVDTIWEALYPGLFTKPVAGAPCENCPVED